MGSQGTQLRTCAVSVAMLVLLAGCGSGSEPRADALKPMTVAEVLEDAEVGDYVRVDAALFTSGGEVQLCDEPAGDSMPMYCAQPAGYLVMTAAPLDDLGLREQEDSGELSGGVDVVVRLTHPRMVEFVENARDVEGR